MAERKSETGQPEVEQAELDAASPSRASSEHHRGAAAAAIGREFPVRAAFNRMDASHDGKVTPPELKVFLDKLGVPFSGMVAEQAVAQLNRTGNSDLPFTYDQLMSLLAQGIAESTVASKDITKPEMTAALLPLMEQAGVPWLLRKTAATHAANLFFSIIDTDNSGVISPAELNLLVAEVTASRKLASK